MITWKELYAKKTEDFKDPFEMLCYVAEYHRQRIEAEKETNNNRHKKGVRNQEEEDKDYEEEVVAEAEARTRKQKKKRSRIIDNGPDPPPDLPREFKTEIAERYRGTQIVLVIQKRIFKTDVNRGHNRFSVPARQVIKEFLTEEEKRKLNDQDLSVVLIQPSLESIEMNMKTWVMHKENGKASSSYMLKTKWGEVVKKNNIQIGDIVQLWAFRTEMRENTLGFALVKIRRAITPTQQEEEEEEEEERGGRGGGHYAAASSSSHALGSA